MAFGVELSVRVAANTRNFTRGMESAEDSLDRVRNASAATSGALQVVQGRADEAADEMSQLARSGRSAAASVASVGTTAAGSTGSLSVLSAVTSGLTLSLGSISNTPLLALVPAAGAALTALLPLAATVGTLTAGVTALAGAFGTVIGTGILAFGQKRAQQNKENLQTLKARKQTLAKSVERLEAEHNRLKQLRETQGSLATWQKLYKKKIDRRLKSQRKSLETTKEQIKTLEKQTSITGALTVALTDLRDKLVPIIADFGEKFIPLIKDALDAIPTLVRNVIDAVGELGAFRNALRDLGGAAMRVIPQVVGAFADLARRSLPLFIDLVQWIGRNAPRIFDSMLRVTKAVAPALTNFVQELIAATPELTALGTQILNVAVPALTKFVDLVESIINFAGGSSGFVDFVRRGINRLIQWMQGPGQQLLSKAVTGLVNTLRALLAAEEGENILTALTGLLGDILQDISNWFDGGGQQRITMLLTDLFGAIADTLTANRKRFKSKIFTPLSNIIASLFDSLTNALASKQGTALKTSVISFVEAVIGTIVQGTINYIQSPAFAKDIQQITSALGNAIGPNLLLPGFGNKMVGPKGQGVSDPIAQRPLERSLNLNPEATPQQRRQEVFRRISGGQTQQGAIEQFKRQIGIEVDVNTSVDQQGQLLTEAEVRQIKRQTGGTNSP